MTKTPKSSGPALVLLLVCLAIISGGPANAQTVEREEFHQTFNLSPTGRVRLQNITGDVRIQVWDRAEVKVDAIKTANTRAHLQEAEIKINAVEDAIEISTEYPNHQFKRSSKSGGDEYNSASVAYELTVPRNARLDSIELVNGDVTITDTAGDIRVSTINGHLVAQNPGADVKLSTVNGVLDVSVQSTGAAHDISLSAVNGAITLTLPSDANAVVRAATVSGAIANDFGLKVRTGQYVGKDMNGLIGKGEARVRLSNVNGSITLKRANDGKNQSPVTDVTGAADAADLPAAGSEAVGADAADALIESQNDVREARRAVERAAADIKRVQEEAERLQQEILRGGAAMQKEQLESLKDAQREIAEARQDAEKERIEAEAELREAEREVNELSKQQSKDAIKVSNDDKRSDSRTSRSDSRTSRNDSRTSRNDSRTSRNDSRTSRNDMTRATAARDSRAVAVDTARMTADAMRVADEAMRVASFEESALKFVERDTKSFTVEGAPTVKLETFDGRVTVRAWDKPEVSVNLVKRSTDQEQAARIKVTANQSGATVTVKVELEKQARAKGYVSTGPTVSLEVFVPRKAAVWANSGDGSMRIEGVSGDLNIGTGDGSITVDGCEGALSIKTGDGSVRVLNHSGEVVVNTGDGSITLEGTFSRLTASTGDGFIKLAVPKETNATLEVNTDDVDIEGFEFRAANGAGQHGPWNIGSGGSVYSLHTGDGRITVRRK